MTAKQEQRRLNPGTGWPLAIVTAILLVALGLAVAPAPAQAQSVPDPVILPAVEEPEDETPFDTFKLSLEEVIGIWRFEDDSTAFVIVPEDPEFTAYTNRLEAHTGERVWKGRYTSFDEGDAARDQDARIVFRYKPTADEMNPKIPSWARKAVEGQLEWWLELDEYGSVGDPGLRAKWFRGRVRWSEGDGGGQTAEVVGEGVPELFTLAPEYGLQIEDMSQTVLTVGLGGNHDPETHPIKSLIKGQHFFIKVELPADVAQEQGTTLTVSIRGLTGGKETTINLTGTKVVGSRRVAYSHKDPATIADCNIWSEPERDPQPLSLFWLYVPDGACIDLDVANNEIVEFRFGKAFQQIVLYDSWVKCGIARHAQGVERLRVIMESILRGDYTPAQKEAAHKRLRMLVNYDFLIASDKLTDLHRFNLGELYFGDAGFGPSLAGHKYDAGIIFMTDGQLEEHYLEHWREYRGEIDPDGDPEFYNPLLKAFLEGLTGKDLDPKAHTVVDDIVWVSDAERYFVKWVITNTSRKFTSKAVRTAVMKSTFGLYDGYVSTFGAGAVYLVVTGRDHFDRPQPRWVRLTAALGLASSAVLSFANTGFARKFLNPTIIRRSSMGKGARSASTLLGRPVRGVEQVDSIQDLANLPRSLNPAKRRKAYLQFVEDPPGSGGPPGVLRSKRKPRPRTLQGQSADLDLLEYFEKEEYVHRVYGRKTEFVDWSGGSVFDKQSARLPTCQERAISYAYWKKTGRSITESEGYQRMLRLIDNDVQAGKRPFGDLFKGAGVSQGYDQMAARRYLRYLGARVCGLKYITDNARVTLGSIWSALEKGWSVKIVIKIPGTKNGYHTAIVNTIEIGKNGRKINMVRVYDPNVGQVIRVPARTFNKLIARDIGPGHGNYGILTLFRFD